MRIRERLQLMKAKLIKMKYKEDNKVELENHPIQEDKPYRLFFIDFHHTNKERINSIIWPFKPFTLPEGMSQEDAFKVLSYLTDYIERYIEPYSFRSVIALDKILNVERLGFKRVNKKMNTNTEDVNNLFTVSGEVSIFKNSPYYNKYFEWYQEGVTFNEVKEIYDRCNREFYDLIPNSDIVKTSQLLNRTYFH